MGRDKLQYFIGNRYLPGAGTEALSLEDDGAHGIWVVNSEGDSTHISLVDMDPVQKALKIVDMFTPYLRYGLAAGANKQGDKWIP